MPRRKAPCGTYPAYQRHLREKTPIDEACREAQQQHDGGRRNSRRSEVRSESVTVPVPAPETDPLVATRDRLAARFGELANDMAVAAGEGWLANVIDIEHDMSLALDAWVQAADELNFTFGYPNHTPEVRARLTAYYRDLAADKDSSPDDISDELRARILN